MKHLKLIIIFVFIIILFVFIVGSIKSDEPPTPYNYEITVSLSGHLHNETDSWLVLVFHERCPPTASYVQQIWLRCCEPIIYPIDRNSSWGDYALSRPDNGSFSYECYEFAYYMSYNSRNYNSPQYLQHYQQVTILPTEIKLEFNNYTRPQFQPRYGNCDDLQFKLIYLTRQSDCWWYYSEIQIANWNYDIGSTSYSLTIPESIEDCPDKNDYCIFKYPPNATTTTTTTATTSTSTTISTTTTTIETITTTTTSATGLLIAIICCMVTLKLIKKQ